MFLAKIKKFIHNRYSEEQRINFMKIQGLKFRGIQNFIYNLLWGSNLKFLATIYGSDKWGSHWYAEHYETHFSKFKNRKINLLEIGIGGYDDPMLGGGSLRMWRTYFQNGKIFGIDIYEKSLHNEKRIKTFKGSQVDEAFLNKIFDDIKAFDLIIDDGSHINEHVICTFKLLFPKLQPGGIYVIEDTQTSYYEDYGGNNIDFNTTNTSMGYFKSLIDSVNYEDFNIPNYQPNYYDLNITEVHFYKNIIFIKKASNPS